MRYRIEIYILGMQAGKWETNSCRKARQIYWQQNNRLDRWTQLYIDGKTGPKAWMDRELGGGQKHSYMVELLGQEFMGKMAEKKRRTDE